MSGPASTPMMHPTVQPSFGTPSTSAYTLRTSESTMPSYVPYISLPQNNSYFPFPGPPQPMAPPQGQPHVRVNFVQPSPIQQFHNFEQLNTENPSHQSNNSNNKGKNQNNNNPGPGGNNPQQNQPVGGNQNQGNQNSEGGNRNKLQGKNNNNLRKNFPCALCGEYGHYTHHFPRIVKFKWIKGSTNGPCPLALPTPQQAPQQYVQQPPPKMLQNPIPHQGVMSTQQEMHPAPPQMGQYQNLGTPVDHTILLTSEEEILLQTHSRQYCTPPKPTPTTSEAVPGTTGPPLMIFCPNTETPLWIPRIPLRWNVNNPQARTTNNYSLVDDLAQSLVAMLVLEVLQTCPTQWNSLLSTLGKSTLLILESSHLI
jgi:hypothetical protein